MREDEQYVPEEDAQEAFEPQENREEAPEEPALHWRPKPYLRGGASGVISTNLTINLICTLCAIGGLLGLFFYFADKRSQAVRRYAVQSIALLFVYAIGATLCFVLGAVLGVIPLLGGVLKAACNLAWLALTVLDLVARVKMMLHAYAGEAYVLPVIGEQARSFE